MAVKRKTYVGLLLCIAVAVWGLKSFCIESYRVPEGEMEQTLLPGEQILVTKWDYGFRLPQTPVHWPFFHDSLPVGNSRSYWAGVQIPLTRFLPRSPERNDIVVFNHPFPADPQTPADRRKISISRCVGLPGDTLKMDEGSLWINGRLYRDHPEVMRAYYYKQQQAESVTNAMNRCGMSRPPREGVGDQYLTFLTSADFQAIVRQIGSDTVIRPLALNESEMEIRLPRSGYPVRLDSVNLAYLYPLIKNHENPRAELRDGCLYIDGTPRFSYVFRNDYYWMLSDNRMEGGGSPRFGAVPHTHLIGKARYIWWSADRSKPLLYSLSYNRIFKGID